MENIVTNKIFTGNAAEHKKLKESTTLILHSKKSLTQAGYEIEIKHPDNHTFLFSKIRSLKGLIKICKLSEALTKIESPKENLFDLVCMNYEVELLKKNAKERPLLHDYMRDLNDLKEFLLNEREEEVIQAVLDA